MPCPSEQTILRYAAGQLDRDALARIDVHMDECSACGELVVHAVRHEVAREPASLYTVGAIPRTRSHSTPVLGGRLDALDPTPATIGRYTIMQPIGRGGMGTVYAAHDPRLERRVAIKVIRRGRGHDSRQLRREARALAALAHPNVVAVFETGELDAGVGSPGQVYLVMELVEGPTLRQWVKARPRSDAAIVAAYRQAGRGLAAAHAMGLVHRDFKPDNVLVGDDDRVRVTDFGLARIVASESGGSTSASMSIVRDEEITAAGMVAGTPGYMAPEQRAGEPTDARADQYAFSVSLWEALTGTRPADGGSAPRSRALRRVLARGLDPDPRRRFASMDDLLDALDAAPRRRVRGLAAAAIGSVLTWAAWPEAMHEAAATERVVDRSDDDEASAAVPDRLAQARELSAADRPDEALVIADAVLSEARSVGDPRLVARAQVERGIAYRYLGDYAAARRALEQAHWSAASVGFDAVAATAATQLVFVVGTLAADIDAGLQWARHAETAIDRLDAEARAEALARLASSRGNLLLTAGRQAEAVADFESALRYNERRYGSDHPEVVLPYNDLGNAWLERDPDAALDYFERGLSIARQAHGEHHTDVALLLANIGTLHQHRGEFALAAEYFTPVLAINEAALGPRHPEVARASYNLGVVQDRLDDRIAARASFLRALDIWTQTLGPEHHLVAYTLDNLAAIALQSGDVEQAERTYHRSLLIYESTVGSDDVQCLSPLSGLAEAAIEQGHGERAVELAQRAVVVARQLNRADAASVQFRLARALWLAGRRGEALHLAERSAADARAGDDPLIDAATAEADAVEIEAWIAEHRRKA